MGEPEKLVQVLRDGTVRHRNFFSGSEAWTVPERRFRPGASQWSGGKRKAVKRGPRDAFCNFCPALYKNTPPEKARLVKRGTGFEKQIRIEAARLMAGPAEFRRISNLFEIATFEYWRKVHGFTPPEEVRAWQASYLASEEGYSHVKNVLALKFEAMERSLADLDALSREEVEELATPFFAGSHELIVARRHLVEGAGYEDELCSSGDLSLEEHHTFLAFTRDALSDIRRLNPHVTMVYVFQNWLKPAGASFDHLHKQLVGTDLIGPAFRRKMERCRADPDAFQRYLEALEGEGLLIAANPYAIAAADTGQPHPAVVVVSSSPASEPEAMSAEELRGMSDLVHACHALFPRNIPSNEEWFFTPSPARVRMPVHLVIKWRMNRLAGFEGAAEIFINPMDPRGVREAAVERLRELRENGITAAFHIGDDCSLRPNGRT